MRLVLLAVHGCANRFGDSGDSVLPAPKFQSRQHLPPSQFLRQSSRNFWAGRLSAIRDKLSIVRFVTGVEERWWGTLLHFIAGFHFVDQLESTGSGSEDQTKSGSLNNHGNQDLR